MVRFTPPKIMDDNDTTTALGGETTLSGDEPKEIENPKVKYKSMFIEQIKTSTMILVNKSIYRRKRK